MNDKDPPNPFRTVPHSGLAQNTAYPTPRSSVTVPNTAPEPESESDFIARLNGNVRAINANLREVNARNLKVEARVDAKDGVVELTVTLFRPIETGGG